MKPDIIQWIRFWKPKIISFFMLGKQLLPHRNLYSLRVQSCLPFIHMTWEGERHTHKGCKTGLSVKHNNKENAKCRKHWMKWLQHEIKQLPRVFVADTSRLRLPVHHYHRKCNDPFDGLSVTIETGNSWCKSIGLCSRITCIQWKQ